MNITTANLANLNLPAKVLPFVTKALDRDLTVVTPSLNGEAANLGDRTQVVISSVNPIDAWELWINHTAGRNGGRLDLHRFSPDAPTRGKQVVKRTRLQAGIQIDDMGDALVRHYERQARKAQAEAALRQVGAELDGAVIDLPAPGARPDVTSRDASTAQVTAAVAQAQADDLTATASQLVSSLRANGRFALRMADTAIPRNTAAKVRVALVRRGLVLAAGGALTDLGKAARELIRV